MSDRRVLVLFDPELLADRNPADTPLARVAEALTDGRVRRGFRFVPGLVSLEVPPGTVDAAIESLARLPGVLYAEHDAKRYPQAVPNDAWYAQQWWAPAVRLPQAWNIRTDASATIVAVLDTGVNYHHPELAPNMWTNMVEANGLTGVDDDGNGYIDDLHGIGVDGVPAGGPASCPYSSPPANDCIFAVQHQDQTGCDPCFRFPSSDPSDVQGVYPRPPADQDPGGHGTAVASLIGAKGNNSALTTGSAWTATILPIRISNNCSYSLTSDFILAAEYAVENNSRVVNLSFGGTDTSLSEEELMRKLDEVGILVVVAAGNGATNLDAAGAQPFYPVSYNRKNQINVAATTEGDSLAGFSNWGPSQVHLAAPGVGIRSLAVQEPSPMEPCTLQQYQMLYSGTSFSAPMVAAAAALLWSHEPLLTHDQVRERLLCSVRQIPALSGKVSSGGILNVEYALLNWQPACN